MNETSGNRLRKFQKKNDENFVLIGLQQQKIDLLIIYQFRELLRALVMRQLTVRYKQTAVGLGWILFQPLIMMLILALVFKSLPGMSPQNIPYPLFILSAYMPWLIFARIVGEGTSSIVSEQGLISRVFFPRIIIPLSVVLVGAFDFLILIVFLLIGYLIFLPEFISIRLLTLPLFMMILLMAGSGVIFWTSALNVRYRDFSIIVPFILSILFFLTPIIYNSNFWPKEYVAILSFNPMLVVVDGFRWALFGTEFGPLLNKLASLSSTIFIFITGLWFFRNSADDFADNI